MHGQYCRYAANSCTTHTHTHTPGELAVAEENGWMTSDLPDGGTRVLSPASARSRSAGAIC